MKRRNFLVGACGVAAGMISPLKSMAAGKPCPPDSFAVDGNSSGGGHCGDVSTKLAELAGGLAPGQSAQFTKNTLQRPEDIQWQVQTIWYDSTRRELQYMGKPASSQSEDYSHYIYQEDTDSWITTGKSLFPGTGHVWNVTFDPVNGDYWFRRYNDNVLRWFDRSDGPGGTWKTTIAQELPALNGGNANLAAMGWHPNLYGQGKPGLFLWSPFRFFGFNLTTHTFDVLTPSNFSSGGPLWDRSTGQALYVPETDQLICFARDRGNGDPAILVNAGAGLSSNVLEDGFVTQTSQPPIVVYGAGGDTNHGHVVHDPNNQNRLLLLEEHGSSRVWHSTDVGSTWKLLDYKHPFQGMSNWSAGEYTVGTVSDYGLIVGMTSDDNGGETIIWKPI